MQTASTERYPEATFDQLPSEALFAGFRRWVKARGGERKPFTPALRSWLDQRLRQKGLRLGRSLGVGAYGEVFQVEGVGGERLNLVAKVTADATEAATAQRLLTSSAKNESAAPVMLGAWRVPNEPWWVVVREGLQPLEILPYAVRRLVYNNEEALAYARGYGDPSSKADDPGRLDRDLAKLKPSERAIVEEYLESVKRIQRSSGVRVLDVNADNVRARRTPRGKLQLVISDLGASTGPAVTVPVARNPGRYR